MSYQQQPPYSYPQPNQPYYPPQSGGQGYPAAGNVGWNTTAAHENAPLSGAPPTVNYHAQPGYAEAGADPKYGISFSDASIRAAFIRKVFILVTIMLAVVAIMSAIPFFNHDFKMTIRQSPGLYYASYGTFLVVYIVLMCCENVRRSFPANLICTGILTLAIGYMTMMLCSMYNLESVILTFIITTIVCGSIIIFSTQTKYDLTSLMGFMFIASMVLLVFGIVAVIAAVAFHVRWLYTIYAGLAALLFMFYLAIDIQMIMGGKKYSIEPEDHIFAAIQVFLDIVYIFWMLLALFGGGSRN